MDIMKKIAQRVSAGQKTSVYMRSLKSKRRWKISRAWKGRGYWYRRAFIRVKRDRKIGIIVYTKYYRKEKKRERIERREESITITLFPQCRTRYDFAS